MNTFLVKYKFTTVRGNCFTGKEGELQIETELSLLELDEQEVKQLCINFILTKKPKWNIFIFDIVSIEPYQKRTRKKNVISKMPMK